MIENTEENEAMENDPDKEERIEREKVIRNLSRLTPREEAIIRLRYGLDDGICRTIEETAVLFNVPREQVRQIEILAHRKLFCPAGKHIGENGPTDPGKQKQ